jgi:hypothetical protein
MKEEYDRSQSHFQRKSVNIDLAHSLARNVEMSISLDLPPELESELSTEASKLNLPVSEYILRILAVRAVLADPPKTGADLVAYWQAAGVVNSRPDIVDSQAHARNLRHEAEMRS